MIQHVSFNKLKNLILESLKINKFKSPEDLKDFYSTVNYRILNIKTNRPFFNTKFETFAKWHLISPEQIMKHKIGICYDTAYMTDIVLSNLGIEHKNYFMSTDAETWEKDPAHAFNLYKDKDGYWRWLEGSWGDFKDNNLKSKDINSLLKKIVDYHKEYAETDNVILREIVKFPKPGISISDFYKKMIQNPVVDII